MFERSIFLVTKGLLAVESRGFESFASRKMHALCVQLQFTDDSQIALNKSNAAHECATAASLPKQYQ
jgi:hypothetical protein